MKNKKKLIIIVASVLVVAIVAVVCVLTFSKPEIPVLNEQELLAAKAINRIGLNDVKFTEIRYANTEDGEFIMVHWKNRVNSIHVYDIFLDGENIGDITFFTEDSDGFTTDHPAKYYWKKYWDADETTTLDLIKIMTVLDPKRKSGSY